MNLDKIYRLKKLYFTADDLARLLSVSKKSAQVTASRYVNSNKLIRLKRDIYILPQKLESISEEELFEIANLLQTPSYVSLTSALSYYNISTQQVQNFVESIALKRTQKFGVNGYEFLYTIFKDELYFGFERKENFFIATPEKALVDSIYLTAMKRYNCDFEAIDFSRLNKNKVEKYLSKTNTAAKNLWLKLTENYKI